MSDTSLVTATQQIAQALANLNQLISNSQSNYGVESLNFLIGNLTLTSTDGSVSITSTGSNINLGVVGPGAGFNVSNFTSGSGFNVAVSSAPLVYLVNKSAGSATSATLPAVPVANQVVVIKDTKGDAASNNITVNGNGYNIDGASDYIIGAAYGWVWLVWSGTSWSILG